MKRVGSSIKLIKEPYNVSFESSTNQTSGIEDRSVVSDIGVKKYSPFNFKKPKLEGNFFTHTINPNGAHSSPKVSFTKLSSLAHHSSANESAESSSLIKGEILSEIVKEEILSEMDGTLPEIFPAKSMDEEAEFVELLTDNDLYDHQKEQDNVEFLNDNMFNEENDDITEEIDDDTHSQNEALKSPDSTIRIKVNSSASSSKSPSGKVQLPPLNPSNKIKKSVRIDKNDPRTRLHYVKYMKKDGKTVKIYECGICWKEFIHQYTLMRHLPTHTDERNFKCNVCGKAFRQMSTLSQHKATHSTSRPYICDICKKTFSRVSSLISHKKIHSALKQHHCSFCNKSFHQKGNLKNHLYTHTNERPYKCEKCGQGFNQASNLHCHKNKAHSDDSLAATNKKSRIKNDNYPKKVKHKSPQAIIPKSSHFSNNPLFSKKKIGNVRIIQLPNGEKTMQNFYSDEQLTRPEERLKAKSGILVDPIDTTAMHEALAAGEIPFALLTPHNASPIITKIQFAAGGKHMLVPATADELKAAANFTISYSSGFKSVNMKISIVAKINQSIDESGQVHMAIEECEDPRENYYNQSTMIVSEQQTITSHNDESVETEQMYILPDNQKESIVVTQDDSMHPIISIKNEIMDVNASLNNDQHLKESTQTSVAVTDNLMDTSGVENLSLIAVEDPISITSGDMFDQSHVAVEILPTPETLSNTEMKNTININGVQYLKISDRQFNEYEMVNNDHPQATHFINEEGLLSPIKQDQTVAVDQENISAFISALNCAGYEFNADGSENQIIINADGNTVMVDNQPVQMVIDGSVMTEDIVNSVIPGINLGQ